MKIQINHMPNTFNYGSCMMGIVLINKLSSEFKDLEIYVDARTDINIERLRMFTNFEKIFYNTDYDKLKSKGFKDGRGLTIVLGGDDMSEHSYKKGYKGLERILNRIYNRTKVDYVFLLGQTIGPFTENRIVIARRCLRNTKKIYTRDDLSFKYLSEFQLKNIYNGRDLAFSELPNQLEAKSILDKYNLKEGEYITVILSGSTALYTLDEESYIKECIKIVANLYENDKVKDKKIVLLPHVTTPGSKSDDRLTIQKIMDRIDSNIKNRVVAILDTMYPTQARAILGNGLFSISGRMHGAVSSYYMRKPAIAISYSIKYAGVIGEGLDMYDLIVEGAKEKYWKNGEISKIVSKKVDYVLDNYQFLIDKIDKNVNEVTYIVEEELNDLIKRIKALMV